MQYITKISKFLTLSAAIALVGSARAAERTWIDDLDLIDLRADVAVVDNTFNYPGINGPTGFDNPDCLALVTSGNFPEGSIERLSTRIQMFDGSGILFGPPSEDVNELQPELRGRERLVYHIVDLSRFLTGLRVAARNGVSLHQAVVSAFGGSYKGLVALQIVRGCRTL